MPDNEKKDMALDLTLRYKTGRSGLFVGFIREFPFITGQAETFQTLADQLFYDLGLYFSKFSEGEEKLARHARTLDTGLNIYGEKPHRLEIERPEIAKDEEGWKEQILVISSKH